MGIFLWGCKGIYTFANATCDDSNILVVSVEVMTLLAVTNQCGFWNCYACLCAAQSTVRYTAANINYYDKNSIYLLYFLYFTQSLTVPFRLG
jgi:hypothetical protein